MSMFLPEGPNQTQAPSGVADITPADAETTSADVALMQRVFAAAARNPNLIPPDFMAYFVDFIQTSRLIIPIGQVFGFAQFTAQSDEVGASESTTSTVFTDLTTVGPTLSGLSDGRYVVLMGAWARTTDAGQAAYMTIDADGSPDGNDGAVSSTVTNDTAISRAVLKTLNGGGGNKITAKYRVGGGVNTATFVNRWLVAIKYSNL